MSQHKQKLEQAIAWLGPRYVLHPARRVTRMRKQDQREIHKTDVAKTFRKFAAKLNANLPPLS